MTRSTITNLITSLYNPEAVTSSDDKVRNLKLTINALTGITCSALMQHCFAVLRGEEPTLDERNEQDAEIRGKELKDINTEELGYDVTMPSLQIARIANGIRVGLFNEMHHYCEVGDVSSLYKAPVQRITEKRNFDQPMSAELYMDFRGRAPAGVNDDEIKAILRRREGITAAEVRAILMEDAIKSARRVKDITDDVMEELRSLTVPTNEAVDEVTGMWSATNPVESFTKLPIETQVRAARAIQRALQKDFERLLPRSIRDIDVAGECDLIEMHITTIRDWINTVEHDSSYESRMAA